MPEKAMIQSLLPPVFADADHQSVFQGYPVSPLADTTTTVSLFALKWCGHVKGLLPGASLPPARSPAVGVPGSDGLIITSLREKVETMPLSKEKKAEIIAQYGKDASDSGSAEVQVALLTQRIRDLTEHLKIHQKDHHTRRGLLMLVGKRRRLLTYIKRNDILKYRELIARLGIRDNI
jgi:small subunit ribosomal protein S15